MNMIVVLSTYLYIKKGHLNNLFILMEIKVSDLYFKIDITITINKLDS